MIKAVVIFAIVSVAHAGLQATVTYQANPSFVGTGGANTVRGVAGTSSVTHQAKAVDSAFSTVRKTDTRITNDAVAPVQYAQYAQPAPVQYAQPIAAAPVQYAQQVAAPVQYAQPAPVQYAQQVAAPVQYAQQVAAPVQYAQQVAAPVQYAQQVAAPVQYHHAVAPVQYAAAPVAKAVAAPAVAYGSKTISAGPAVAAYHQPAVQYASPVQYAHAVGPAPVQYAAQPVLAQQAVAKVAAPVQYAAAPVARLASPLVAKAAPGLLGVAFSPVQPATASLHFNGFGTSYTLF